MRGLEIVCVPPHWVGCLQFDTEALWDSLGRQPAQVPCLLPSRELLPAVPHRGTTADRMSALSTETVQKAQRRPQLPCSEWGLAADGYISLMSLWATSKAADQVKLHTGVAGGPELGGG